MGGLARRAHRRREREPPVRGALLDAGRSLRWYVRQLTGEAKWDEYLAHCGAHGEEPMSRREFERLRSEHQERHPQSRCC